MNNHSVGLRWSTEYPKVLLHKNHFVNIRQKAFERESFRKIFPTSNCIGDSEVLAPETFPV